MSTVLHTKEFTAGKLARRLYKERVCGEVIGVFSGAIYCAFGNAVLLFHDAKWGEVPFGIAVPNIRAFLTEMRATVGEKILFIEGGICIGDRDFAMTVTVPMRPEAEQLCMPDAVRLAAVDAYITAHGTTLGMLAYCRENRGGAAEAIHALSEGIACGDTAFAAAAAIRLLGLGRGLTPSGDDYLCGFFTLLAAAKANGIAASPVTERVADIVRKNLARTSRISGAYLESALCGEYFTVYDHAIRAMLGASSAEEHCRFVLQMGASSGTDTLCGALDAARLLQR